MLQRIFLGGLAAILIGLGVATVLFAAYLPDLPTLITGAVSADLPPPNITPERVKLVWTPRNTTPSPAATEDEEPILPSQPTASSGGSSRRSSSSSSSRSSSSSDDREIVTLTVSVANVTQLAGAQFEVRYDSSTTQLRTVSEGAFLDDGSTSNALLMNTPLDTQTGQLVAIFRVVDGGVSGSGILMTATFSTSDQSDISVAIPLLSNNNAQAIPASALSWTVV